MNEDATPLEDFIRGKDEFDLDPLTLPVSLAGSSEWDMMDPERRNRILGGMLRHTVARAKAHVPLYQRNVLWQAVHPEEIVDVSDLEQLPIISKDSLPGTGSPSQTGIKGFRAEALEDPHVLIPDNLGELLNIQEASNPNHSDIFAKYRGRVVMEFGSGGSTGKSTITKLTYLTVETEAHALARCLHMNGFQKRQSIACFYAPEHKGGWQLERAADIMGMAFHSKERIFSELKVDRRYSTAIIGFQTGQEILKREDATDEDRAKALAMMIEHSPLVRDGIRNYIQRHGIHVIESVQPSSEFMSKNTKGGSLAFMTIYDEDPRAFGSVEHVFLTGFPVPTSAYERLRADGMRVSTTWGSTEMMALATSQPKVSVNDLIATPFPTVGQVVWYREREHETPRCVPPPCGLEGVLLVTSLLGAGSLYLNYMIGDIATKTERGYCDIHRLSSADIAGSCAADALSV